MTGSALRRSLGCVVAAAACSNGSPSADGGIDASIDVAAFDDASDGPSCTPAPGSGTVTGTLGGSAFQVVGALSTIDPFPVVVLADYANACAAWEANANVASSSTLAFTFGAVFSVGTFTTAYGGAVGPSNVEVDYTGNIGPACYGGGGYERGISGSVTVTAVDGCQVAGTFDVTLGDGTWAGSDHITGSFIAPTCVSPPADAGAGACLQPGDP